MDPKTLSNTIAQGIVKGVLWLVLAFAVFSLLMWTVNEALHPSTTVKTISDFSR